MPRLLKLDGDADGAPTFVADPWQRIEAADAELAELPAGPVLVPLAFWETHRDALLARDDGSPDGKGELGVWLDSDQEAEAIAADLPALSLIALNFPVFSDGRSLSNAVLLRTRFDWRGELRAIGDVQRDQLAYMRRCGFDAFAIRPDLDPEAAAAGLRVMSDHYQGDVHEPRPAFLRVERPAA